MNYANEALINEIMNEIRNQRKHDKGSIGYKIGMMSYHATGNLFWHIMTRAEVVNQFNELIHEPKLLARLHNGTCLQHIFSKYE